MLCTILTAIASFWLGWQAAKRIDQFIEFVLQLRARSKTLIDEIFRK